MEHLYSVLEHRGTEGWGYHHIPTHMLWCTEDLGGSTDIPFRGGPGGRGTVPYGGRARAHGIPVDTEGQAAQHHYTVETEGQAAGYGHAFADIPRRYTDLVYISRILW